MTAVRSLTRRTFLGASAGVAAALAGAKMARAETTGGARAHAGHVLVPVAGRWNDPDLSALAAHGVAAAVAAGAQYADARISLTERELWNFFAPSTPAQRFDTRGIGVRALVNGYWGFFGSAVWTTDEMTRLARGAVAQAKSNALGGTRDLPLGTIPRVNGEWTMPVKYDPFTISLAEKYDYVNQIRGAAHQLSRLVRAEANASFARTTKVFASSEGSSWRQTTYLTEGRMGVTCEAQPGNDRFGAGSTYADTLTPAGAGWEYVCDAGLIEQLPGLIDVAEQSRMRTFVDVGRYDVVCSAYAAAALANATIGVATELDRALGYEANAGGTSYLDDPLAMLGSYQVGSPLLTVTANRSHAGGAATVQWDDEAVVPEPFTLVQDGVLTDYQTTREQAAWLAPYYVKRGLPVRSHGCAASQTASRTTLQHPPNLQLMPGARETEFDELVAGTEKGVAILELYPMMDPQQLNGVATGVMREIVKGKLGRFIMGGALDFRAPELWKNVGAIGGPRSARWFGMSNRKGEPEQGVYHSVGAVPVKFTNGGIIDFMRKA